MSQGSSWLCSCQVIAYKKKSKRRTVEGIVRVLSVFVRVIISTAMLHSSTVLKKEREINDNISAGTERGT